jgi:ribonuclease H2 subunit A
MIRKVLNAGAKVEEVYVDTVGDPIKYEQRLKTLFPTIRLIKVCPKADSIYPIVSAASIVAKVNRDYSVQSIASIMIEPAERIKDRVLSVPLGSGYPSDEKTKDWMRATIDSVFLYPSIVRFSWDTVNQIAESAGAIEFDFHDDDDMQGQQSIVGMFAKKRPESKLFSNRNLTPVSGLPSAR